MRAGTPRVIALITDFGLSDPYVGIMKGVILSINPAAKIVDVSHMVRPQDIFEGAFTLSTSFYYFPPSTIHVVVVDPGVGGERAALLVETDSGTFIGPDNGVLSWAIGFGQPKEPHGRKVATIRRIIELNNSRYWLPRISQTFHGRDVFAPVAAHLSLGVPPDQLGRETSSFQQLPWPALERKADGALVGSVIHVDRFGNLITNVPAEEIEPAPADVSVDIAGRHIASLSHNYSGPGLLAVVGSSGYLEVAVARGNAAAELGVGRGAEVVVRRCSSVPATGKPR